MYYLLLKEEDFKIRDDEDDESSEEEKTKPLFYKDMIRESILNKDVKKKKLIEGETPFEEQERLKREFKLAIE